MNKRKTKQVEESFRQFVKEFLKDNPGISYSDYMKHVEMVTTVGLLPPVLFQKYKDSGMTVEEVYNEIKGGKN